MEIKKEERIRLTDTGYRKICELVDRRATDIEGVIHCEWCGKSVGAFQHHHIRFRSAYGSDTLENLMCLCDDCHANKAHSEHSKRYVVAFKARMASGYMAFFNVLHWKDAQEIYQKYRKE